MSANRTLFMFSGQGSQYYQMGRELFEREPTFRKCLLDMDGAVRNLIGLSVVETVYDGTHGKTEPFERTLLTSPAIFMVEVALARTLIERNLSPDLVLGVSMGAFAAAVIAGCIDMADALAAVVEQAKTVEKYCKRGGMIAVLSDQITHQDKFLFSNCEVAAVNLASHFVVAAKHDQLEIIELYLKNKGVTFQRLPVSYAFHSRWIDEAEFPFRAYLETLSYKPPQVPVICCAGVCCLKEISKEYFWTAAREPVRFRDTIAYLERNGRYRYVDAVPAGSLATLVQYGLDRDSASQVLSTLSPFGRDLDRLNLMTGAKTSAGYSLHNPVEQPRSSDAC